MVVKKRFNSRMGGGWFSSAACRTCLAQVLLIIFLVSVGLNVFLLFFRSGDLRESKRLAAETSQFMSNNWGQLIKKSRDVTHQIMTTKRQDVKNKPLKPDNVLHVHSNSRITKPKNSKTETSTPVKVKDKRKTKLTKDVAPLDKTLPICPLTPRGLVGSLRAQTKDIKPYQLQKLFPDLEKGGRIRPKNCVPRERLAIIIPFRDRQPHLYILLQNLIPFLQRQMADATIFIIEQAPPATFNRGALLNIGFLEALKLGHFDCFVLHDVDLIPLNDRNFYRCGKNPRHYAVAMNKHRFRLMYEEYFGGVVGMSREQYIKVNGNSNLYFGWGGEDDDLGFRIVNKNYSMDRYDNLTARYVMIKHTRDKGNDKNSERRNLMNSALKRQDVEGLNTTKYKVNHIKYEQLYTWINVSLNMKEVLETAPNYTRHDIWKLMRDVRLGKLQ